MLFCPPLLFFLVWHHITQLAFDFYIYLWPKSVPIDRAAHSMVCVI